MPFRHYRQAYKRISPLAKSSYTGVAEFSDNFNRADGVLGGTWLGGTNWQIVSNRVVNTPVSGSNLVVNGTFDADTNWNKGAGWAIAGGVAAQSVGSGTSDLTATVAPLTTGRWYQFSFSYSNFVGGFLTGIVGGVTGYGHSGEYVTPRTEVVRSVSTSLTIRSSNNTVQVDNFIVRLLSLVDLLNLVAGPSFNSAISATLTITGDSIGSTTYAQGGVAACWDSSSNPNSGIIAFHDGVNARLLKQVAGTWTSVINISTPYSSGATIQLRRSGTTFQLFYNGSQVGTNQTISDSQIINNTLHGLFATHAGYILDNVSIA